MKLGRTCLPRPPAIPLVKYVVVQLVLVPSLLAATAWILQYSRLDIEIARAFADPATGMFEWRDSKFLDLVGHQAARGLPILVGGLAFAAGAAGFAFQRLRPWRRIFFTTSAAIIVGPVLIDFLKTLTTEHCPRDLVEFGGAFHYAADQAAPFWAPSRAVAGRCLPSGHAGGGYALLSLYFAGWAAGRSDWRWRGLAVGVVAGVLFSLVRMMQGAHFASATAWSAVIDWTGSALLFLPLLCQAEYFEEARN